MCEALLDLFNRCLLSGTVPQDFRDALTVTIYKRKGDRAECGNHRGISLLAIAGKVLAKIVLNRLKFISEEVLLESQCGFRQSRSASDIIFTLPQLQEKAAEQHQPCILSLLISQRHLTPLTAQPFGKSLKYMDALKSLLTSSSSSTVK